MRTFLRILSTITIGLCAITALPYLNTLDRELSPVNQVAQRVKVIGYDRQTHFGGWQSGVREEVVAAAGSTDPYSGELFGTSAEVDHIFPLSAAWDLGAHEWTLSRRIEFANDPLNLILVSRQQNQEKSDQLPHQWLPKQRSYRCTYAEKLTAVAHNYELPLPAADLAVAKRQCGFAKFW